MIPIETSKNTALNLSFLKLTNKMAFFEISGKKTLQIKNFRIKSSPNPEFFQEQLNQLSYGLKIILETENTNFSYEKLYRSVENLTQSDKRQTIYNILTEHIESFLNERLRELLLSNQKDFFKCLILIWQNYYKKVIVIKNVYLCYDRSSQNGLKFDTIHFTCMKFFKNIIILQPAVSKNITTQLLNIVNEERKRLNTDKESIEIILPILTKLDVYNELFEIDYLIESKKYFENEKMFILNKKIDVSSYLEHIINLVKEEEGRKYIFRDTLKEVLKLLYREMVESCIPEILSQGFDQLIHSNNMLSLRQMYNLFTKVSSTKCIEYYFKTYLESNCSNIIKNGNDKSMIEELINFKDKLDKIIQECFESNKIFDKIIRDIFEKLINTRSTDSALYLAKFIDSKLKSKNINEDDLEDTLDKFMMIFRLIQGKDIFKAYYKKDLGKRLIFDKSANKDIEQSIVARLKKECGEAFTAKLEGMLTDINLATKINSNFKDYLVNFEPYLLEKSDVSILVLTSGFWTKSITNSEIILPDQLLRNQKMFLKYYTDIHTGRKLDWQPNLGYCTLRAYFPNSTKELLVSMFQTIVLLLFNQNSQLSLKKIHELTNLDHKDLIATLHSLSCTKLKILIKEPENNQITMEDSFKFNENFTDKLYRIKINQAQLIETVDELKATEKSVLIDRRFQIDAAIMRIMKREKIVKHNELVAELLKILDIPVQPQDLKKRIELLIEREYIKRDFDNAARYLYIA